MTRLYIICLLITGLSFQAYAQSSNQSKTKGAQSSKNKKSTKKQTNKTPNPKQGQVIEFKQLSVEGTVQRPSAAYLLQRRKLKFKGLVPKKSFIPKILNSVKKAPF